MSKNKTELQIIEQKEISFYDDQVTAVKLENGKIVSPIARLSENIGLSSNNQIIKVKDNPSLNSYDIILVANDGKQRVMTCIDVDDIPYWTSLINPQKVKPEVKDKLVAYQRE